MRFSPIWPLLALVLCGGVLKAEDKSEIVAEEKLKTIIDATGLDATGVRPWHWKMDVTLYDTDGKNPQSGSIEAWFADGNMRTVLTLGDAQVTTLRSGDKLYRTDSDAVKFVPLEIVFMHALRPVPSELLQPPAKLKLVQQTIGKTKLDCVRPTFTLPEANTFSMDTPLSYCLAEGTDQFLVAYQPAQTSVARTQIGSFLSKQIPLAFQISSLSKKRAEAKTTSLSTFTPGVDDFALLPTMHPLDDSVEVPASNLLLLGMALNKDSPHYPESAKSRHVEGAVKFDVVIGKDGTILSKHVTNKADVDLVDAASKSTTHSIYRPYLVNGLPVQVKTTLTVNFNLVG